MCRRRSTGSSLCSETSANRFTISDNDHWAAPLDGLLRRVLTQGVAARLPSGKVIFPDSPKPIDTGSVVVDILALSPSSQPEWSWMSAGPFRCRMRRGR